MLVVFYWAWATLTGYTNFLEFSLQGVLATQTHIIKISSILLIHFSTAVSDHFGAIFVEKVRFIESVR